MMKKYIIYLNNKKEDNHLVTQMLKIWDIIH